MCVVVSLLLAGLIWMSGCRGAVPSKPTPGSSDSTITAAAGAWLLSLHVHPVVASAGETITATVKYTNVSTQTALVVAPGGAYYNVRVTSNGKAVFDSFPFPPDASLPPSTKGLAPGATMSGVVSFSLRRLGTYEAVAYLNGLTTPPVRVVIWR
jgi:hypothetical protein